MISLNVSGVITRCLSPALLALSAFSACAHSAPEPIDRVVAVVDDDVVMQSDLNRRIAQVKQQNSQLPPEALVREQVLERLIVENIQLQMADRAGVRISDGQLNEATRRIAEKNGKSLEAFKQSLEQQGVRYLDVREQILNDLKMQQVQRFQVAQRIEITDKDVDLFLNSELGKVSSAKSYQLGHILVAINENSSAKERAQAEQKVRALRARLLKGEDFRTLAIAESNGSTALKGGDLGWRKEVELPSLFADVVPNMKQGEVSQPIASASGFHLVKVHEVRGGKQHWENQTQVRHILIQTNELRDDYQAKALIHTLHKRLALGEDMAALAKQYSDDPGSGSQGGDLGWVSPGKMVPEFESTMNRTSEGALSAPFQSQFGWHVLRVEKRRKNDVGEQLQRDQVRQMLFSKRLEEEMPIWLRKIRQEAYVDIKP